MVSRRPTSSHIDPAQLRTVGATESAEDPVTLAPNQAEAIADEPLELLRGMLEEQFVVQTNQLTALVIYGRLPGHGGHDPRTLDALAASVRRSIADTAHALRRMSEGTYGVCEDCHRPIPLGRLRAAPHAHRCARCPG
jgi:DnaK suppressor protein